MFQEQEDVFYYITVMNENYEHPEMPAGAEADIIKGMYLLRRGQSSDSNQGGTASTAARVRNDFPRSHRRRRTAQERLGRRRRPLGLPELYRTGRNGNDVQRWNMLNPLAKPRVSHVEACLNDTRGPIIAATDYVRMFADQIRPFLNRRYVTLGTDGFGRSDTRARCATSSRSIAAG
jgi:pyruvate dehydrogenase E1 component